MIEEMRIDKWLWAARFYKTRSLAAKACELGRVHISDVQTKPAREIKPGDKLRVKNDSGEFTVEVVGVSETRGPAAEAKNLYRETEESKAARAKAIEDRKLMPFLEALPTGKPSKKDRRDWNRFRGR
jgi:ribosome-associated heat shock protein Hsp15